MREIDVRADSDAAKKPAKANNKMMLTIAIGLIEFASTFLRFVLAGQT